MPQKKSLHAAERDTVEGKAKRALSREQITGVVPADNVFLDESGGTTGMTRRYGLALRGHRIQDGTPGGRWQTVTMLGAIGTEGWTAIMTVPAPADSEIVLACLNEVLCPAFRPRHGVRMDNLAAHKIAGVAEAISAVGARVLYLPPYSPDFNPIEPCWFVVKQCLRKLKARSLSATDEAIPIAIARVSKQTIANCFRNCGYELH